MSNLFQAVFGFLAPKPPLFAKRKLIEAVNDCGEKRYIEVERVVDRREKSRSPLYEVQETNVLRKEEEMGMRPCTLEL
jgi:hypothetical protein